MSRACGDIEKACAVQSWRRTAATALEKVAAGLAYHAARRDRTRPRAARLLAQSVTSSRVGRPRGNDYFQLMLNSEKLSLAVGWNCTGLRAAYIATSWNKGTTAMSA